MVWGGEYARCNKYVINDNDPLTPPDYVPMHEMNDGDSLITLSQRAQSATPREGQDGRDLWANPSRPAGWFAQFQQKAEVNVPCCALRHKREASAPTMLYSLPPHSPLDAVLVG